MLSAQLSAKGCCDVKAHPWRKDRANSSPHASNSTSANPNPPPMLRAWVFECSSLPQRDEPSCFQHSCQLKGVVKSKLIHGKDRANSLAHASNSTNANHNPPPMLCAWVFDCSSLPQRDEPSCFQHSCQLKGVVMSKLILGKDRANSSPHASTSTSANPNLPPMLCAWVFDCSSVPQRDEPSCFQHSCQLKGVVMSKLILVAKIAQKNISTCLKLNEYQS